MKGYPKQLFAIKSLKKSDYTDKTFEYFKSELDILKEVDHPNIVKFFECYQDDTFYHLVLRLCEGSDLVKIVESERGLQEHHAKKFFY